ncbi:DUF6883 domain-containing protein [Synechococcus sp. BA-132 BA5]|uniref:DUF6883 domain-containing protein n=1 Tax=Synechococcus sp. BA-132 BA5 TaxID=3110252 RepID=UPI002B21B8BB|nr:DUF6883 domain-containing protein [Synechococcus sp. BA-132 BA5]MEA5416761.1 hypothetical protein [Synechococcus sp. BA-132 BA5]
METWARLRDDLLHHGRTRVVQRIGRSAFGMNVVIRAGLEGPNGTSRQFRTIWLIANHPIQPRLITAFPE